MQYSKLRKTKKVFCLSLLLSLISIPVTDIAFAQTTHSGQARQGFPGRRVGGGTRGDCLANKVELVALIPETNLSVTTAANPQLLFYISQLDASRRIEFVLRDQNDQQVYAGTFGLNQPSGIVKLDLLNGLGIPPLEMNQNYHWYLSIIQNPDDRAKDVVVDGWMRRIPLNPQLANQLDQSLPLDEVALYESAGLYHDALITLATLQNHARTPQNFDAWQALLSAVGLEKFANHPLVEANVVSLETSPQQVTYNLDF